MLPPTACQGRRSVLPSVCPVVSEDGSTEVESGTAVRRCFRHRRSIGRANGRFRHTYRAMRQGGSVWDNEREYLAVSKPLGVVRDSDAP